jgi:1,4-dihydroxy-2-naphthoate octaprenyltransferase
MAKHNYLIIWFQQIRAPFLILSVVLVLIGTAAAHSDGFNQLGYTALLLTGVVLSHVSVNLFNELSDFKTEIDLFTFRTPFSGGSGMMLSGKTSPGVVKMAAYGTMAAAGIIGLYFIWVSGWLILLFIVAGAFAIRFYTSHLAKWLIGELIAGLTLGTFVVLGSYYVIAGHLSREIVLLSIPPGILTGLLLLMNEFPDEEADKRGGRNHLVIYFGKKISAKLYTFGLAAVYLIILIIPFISDTTFLVLVALLTIPVAVWSSVLVLRNYGDSTRMVPALGMNVGVVILTDFLLALGLFL